MTMTRLTTSLFAFLAAIAMFTGLAHAGGKKLYFGGPLGTFEAKRSPGGSSKSYGNKKSKAYKAKKAKAHQARKAKARAAAQAKARAKAEARRKAYAKAKAREADKQRAARARAAGGSTVANEKSGPTESNTAQTPSTAAILTRNALARQQEEAKKAEGDAASTENDDESVTVAKTNDASAAKEAVREEPETSEKADEPVKEEGDGGCKRFIPEVGMTISVDC